MDQQARTDDARHILAVDPAGEATTVAIAPMQVADLAQVVLRGYPGLRVEEAVRRFLTDEGVEATDVVFAQAVIEPDTTTPTRDRLHAELHAALGDVSVWFGDRRDAEVRAWLTGAPEVPAVAGAVLSMGDYSRGESPAVDQPTAEALLAANPVGFERWVVMEIGGAPADWLEGDQGIDGAIWSRARSGNPGRLLVAVKAGTQPDTRTVADLAQAVEAHEAAGAVLICMTPPQPDTYEAARRAGAATPGPEGDVAVVQVLTVAEVLNGRRPEGRAA